MDTNKRRKSMKDYMKILGFKVKDVVTGYEGVATSVSFDLYGCVQVVVTPGPDKDNKVSGGTWFDHKRLKCTSKTKVMAAPSFESVPGGQTLPSQDRYQPYGTS
jgi:hypothetical protein